MRKRMLLLISVFFILFSQSVNAEKKFDTKQWLELNHTADQVLQLVKEEKYSDAKQLLEFFSKQFLAIRNKDKNLTMTQLRVITTSYENAHGALTSVSAPHQQRVNAVSELRLVIDAFTSEHHPLWKKTETQIMGSIKKMELAIDTGDKTSFNQSLNDFLQKYGIIRPAILVDLQPQQFQRVDSHVKFLEKYRASIIEDTNKQNQIKIMKQDFEEMYRGFEEDQADPSLWWVMFSIGGTIMLSLIYVGYKKYKAEKDKVKIKQK